MNSKRLIRTVVLDDCDFNRISGGGATVSGFNDSIEEIKGMARTIVWLKNIATIKLLPYHFFGQAKCVAIGENNTMEKIPMTSKSNWFKSQRL